MSGAPPRKQPPPQQPADAAPLTHPASGSVLRRIEWVDTDAAGIYHWSTAVKLFEVAEAALHDRLGIREDTFGHVPRVHLDADFRAELAFYDLVEVHIAVAVVGRSSVRYDLRIERDGELAVEGTLVGVYVSHQPGGTSSPWPDRLREALTSAGPQNLD